MRIFISSVINGFERYRNAARDAVDYVRKSMGVSIEPIMVEKDYPSLTTSPQQACLDGARSCDVYILILGSRYGWVNPESTLAATHEEYLAAKQAGKQILVFVQGVKKDPAQQDFVKEVSDYTRGKYRTTFRNVDGLRLQIQAALEWQLGVRGALNGKPGASGSKYTQNIYGNPTAAIQHVDTLNLDFPHKKKG